MRFVAVKSAEKQASGMAFKTRDLLARQRTQTVNALRGHRTEYGIVAPLGTQNLPLLGLALDSLDIPEEARGFCAMMLDHIGRLSERNLVLDGELRRRAAKDDLARRLMPIPGCRTDLRHCYRSDPRDPRRRRNNKVPQMPRISQYSARRAQGG